MSGYKRPSLDELKACEDAAWQRYARTCFHPLEAVGRREHEFRRAMDAFTAVQVRQRAMLAESQFRERMASV